MRGGLLIVLVGCGRIAFDPRDDGATADTRVASGPFGVPVAVSFNGANEDDDPALAPGLLELVFDSYRPGFEDNLWVVTRASVTSPWSTPVPIAEVYTSADDDGPFITYDGRTMYFSSTRGGGPGGDDMWMTTRASAQDAWAPPTLVPGLSTAGPDFSLTTTADELYGVFASNRAATRDLYEVTRAQPTDLWSTPVRIAALSDDTSVDDEPMLLADGLTLVMGSSRRGTFDLYIATRTSRSEPWGAPVPIAELNTDTEQENDPWLSADGSQLWFTRGEATDRDIYTATR